MALHRGYLYFGRGDRHHDRRLAAELLGGKRHALRVVAGGSRENAPREGGGRKLRHLVVRAAQLEGVYALEVFALEEDRVANLARKRFGLLQRRFNGNAVNLRIQDLLQILR